MFGTLQGRIFFLRFEIIYKTLVCNTERTFDRIILINVIKHFSYFKSI